MARRASRGMSGRAPRLQTQAESPDNESDAANEHSDGPAGNRDAGNRDARWAGLRRHGRLTLARAGGDRALILTRFAEDEGSFIFLSYLSQARDGC